MPRRPARASHHARLVTPWRETNAARIRVRIHQAARRRETIRGGNRLNALNRIAVIQVGPKRFANSCGAVKIGAVRIAERNLRVTALAGVPVTATRDATARRAIERLNRNAANDSGLRRVGTPAMFAGNRHRARIAHNRNAASANKLRATIRSASRAIPIVSRIPDRVVDPQKIEAPAPRNPNRAVSRAHRDRLAIRAGTRADVNPSSV